MSIEVMVAIPSSSASAILVNDQERRVHREMDQLLSDIRRINPQGASYCTFGELFVDPGVEQYYEALVGTMKAAKRNGLISFKGQFLLKGMHDEVIVRIVDSNDDGTAPENNENKSTTRSCGNTKAPSGTMKYGRHCHRHNAQPELASTSTGVENHLKKDISNGSTNSSVASRDAEPERTPYRPKLKARIELKRAKSMHLVGETRRPRSNWNTQLKRTASTCTLHSNRKPETHFERVDREVNQLLTDILRITPEGSPFCTFGPLFEDPQVEQYYEALVGTLKSAKRKGLIRFKGQMLLKGMHDNVQIDIVK